MKVAEILVLIETDNFIICSRATPIYFYLPMLWLLIPYNVEMNGCDRNLVYQV